jgi:hypothetical protein
MPDKKNTHAFQAMENAANVEPFKHLKSSKAAVVFSLAQTPTTSQQPTANSQQPTSNKQMKTQQMKTQHNENFSTQIYKQNSVRVMRDRHWYRPNNANATFSTHLHVMQSDTMKRSSTTQP